MIDLFTHGSETPHENNVIYQKEKSRLSINALIILFCLLEGQELTAIEFVTGICFKGMRKKKLMCEYRRRVTELKEAHIPVKSTTIKGSVKKHWIDSVDVFTVLKAYEKYKPELLQKLNM